MTNVTKLIVVLALALGSTNAFAQCTQADFARECRMENEYRTITAQQMEDCVAQKAANAAKPLSTCAMATIKIPELAPAARDAQLEATEAQCRNDVTIFSFHSKRQQYVDCMVVAGYVWSPNNSRAGGSWEHQ